MCPAFRFEMLLQKQDVFLKIYTEPPIAVFLKRQHLSDESQFVDDFEIKSSSFFIPLTMLLLKKIKKTFKGNVLTFQIENTL